MLNVVRITCYVVLALFAFDMFNIFQTKIELLKVLVHYGVLILPIPLLLLEFSANKSLTEKILRKGIPVLAILGMLYVNPVTVIWNQAPWKTQTVVLVNKDWDGHRVELQMKDMGALGYAKRTCEVTYISKYFYIVWAKTYDDRNSLGHQWKRVDRTINEMGLR